MAEIVLGLGTSHSPMLSLPGSMWSDYAARDKTNPMLLSLEDGSTKTYEELLETADPAIATRLTPEIFQEQYEACQRGIVALEEAMLEADPDVVVIVGDDQEELFFDDNMPLFFISFVGVIITSVIFLRENKKYQSEFAETCSIEGCENKANIPSNKELCTKHDETHKTNLRRSRLGVIPDRKSVV